MLFYLYLASVAVSVVVIYITTISFLERLKRNHISIINHFSLWDKVKSNLFTLFKVVVPIFNLVYLIYLLCGYEHIYQKMVTKLFLEGKAMFDHGDAIGEFIYKTR